MAQVVLALAHVEGEQGYDRMDELLALDQLMRRREVRQHVVEHIAQYGLAKGRHVGALGDAPCVVPTFPLIVDVGSQRVSLHMRVFLVNILHRGGGVGQDLHVPSMYVEHARDPA